LGINRIKSRLEDLSFKYLEPDEYRAIADLIDEKLTEREEYKDKLVEIITRELEAAGIEAKVDGRPKHIYSIYQKISQKGVPFEQIRDLIGLRIWVNTTAECYAVIGILHSKWPHIPERLKDLIGLPKPNGYKSLHSTILDGGDGGRSVEIQVRTHDMHEVAEYGIAAHWSYKKGIPLSEEGQSIYVELRHMLKDIQGLNHPPHQFIQSMKQELFSDEVYVFSPKGDLYALAADATPVDFAYKIHTDVGHTCFGAEVNGELVPLRTCLRNGDRVKILTTPNGHPNRDWLKCVKTSTARNKIRHWFNEQDRRQALELGKRLLEDAMRKQRIGGGQADRPLLSLKLPELLAVVEKLKLKTVEDLLRHIGNGKFSAPDITRLLKSDDSETEAEKQLTVSESMLSIPLDFQSPFHQDIDVAMGRLMKCCNPIPGDEITAYITRGRGISIHRAGCIRLRDEPERMIHMEWAPVEGITHPTEIVFECIDRPGMLFEITKAIAKCAINIRDGNIGDANKARNLEPDTYKAWENGTGYDRFTLEVTGVEQLSTVIAAIRQIKGVQRVDRKT
jgi:GTP pyrophosphokinase